MDDSPYFSGFGQTDIFAVYNGNSAFLVVCRIRFAAAFFRFEFRKPVFLFSGLTETVPVSGLQMYLGVWQSETVYFF